MKVCIVRIILKNIGMFSEKLYVNHVCMVHPKKILTNHRQTIPTSSLVESESFTNKLCSFIQ